VPIVHQALVLGSMAVMAVNLGATAWVLTHYTRRFIQENR
jgi:hypothetical protein